MGKYDAPQTIFKPTQCTHGRPVLIWTLLLIVCSLVSAGHASPAGVTDRDYRDLLVDLVNRSVFKNSQCRLNRDFSVHDVTDNVVDVYYSEATSEKCQSLLQRRLEKDFSYMWEGALYQFSLPDGGSKILRVRTELKVNNIIMDSNFGAWAKIDPDGSWSQAAYNEAWHSTLPFTVPRDVEKFCPSYIKRAYGDRSYFWAGLLSIMARPESNFNPSAKYTESFMDNEGKPVVSRGLLQLSIESAKGYKCDAKANVKTAQDLHDPGKNIACASVILDKLVNTDNTIATYEVKGEKPSGGGRYWSVLREKNGHLPEIMAFTRSLEICK